MLEYGKENMTQRQREAVENLIANAFHVEYAVRDLVILGGDNQVGETIVLNGDNAYELFHDGEYQHFVCHQARSVEDAIHEKFEITLNEKETTKVLDLIPQDVQRELNLQQ